MLFSGFMDAAVGSYSARVQPILHIRVRGYPPLWVTWRRAAIYVNFFAQHWLPDQGVATYRGRGERYPPSLI